MEFDELLMRSMRIDMLFVILAALVAFVLTLVVVLRGKGTMVGPALVFIVPLPMLVCIFLVLYGNLDGLRIIAASEVPVKVSDMRTVICISLLRLCVGMLSMVPSYLLATGVLITRSLQADSTRQPLNEE